MASVLDYIDPLYYLGLPTVSNPQNGGYNQTVMTDTPVTPTNGGVLSKDNVSGFFSGVGNSLTDVSTILKVVVVGAMIFGALVIVHEAKTVLKG